MTNSPSIRANRIRKAKNLAREYFKVYKNKSSEFKYAKQAVFKRIGNMRNLNKLPNSKNKVHNIFMNVTKHLPTRW